MNTNKDDLKAFQKIIEETAKDKELDSDKDLVQEVPRHDTEKHGSISLVRIDGLALTEKGQLTRATFFDHLDIDRETYGDIVLTPEEARSLTINYKKLSTGVNATVPLRCAGDQCPFKEDCWYWLNRKAPIGKRCLVEYDLLNYHTRKFMEEFDVDLEDHSEVMLIQELSELIVYEMRVSMVLARPENATIMGVQNSTDGAGGIIENEVEHWAWNLKERIKNRRMKILEALNATRKSKAGIPDPISTEDTTYASAVKQMKNLIDEARKLNDAKPTKVEPIE